MADTPEDLRRLARELCDHEPASFSLDVLHEAARLAHDEPAALTDQQLQHIAVYEPKTILALVRKRAAAQQGYRDAAAQREAARAPAAAPIDAADKAIAHAPLGSVAEAADILERSPTTPVTAGILAPVVRFLHAMNENNKRRNARLDALEQRNADLEQQIKALRLELDVDRAVRS